MEKYKVLLTYPVTVEVTVEIPKEKLDELEDPTDEDQIKDLAIDRALIEGTLSHYGGNGGWNKLIGVSGSNVSIDYGWEPLEGESSFSIDVEKVRIDGEVDNED